MKKLLEMHRGGSETKPIAAVAAYEDAPTDARVSQFCGNLTKCLGGKTEVNRQMWLLNELRMPQLRAIAAHEAAEADLVIISVHHTEKLPLEMQSWIDTWVGQKDKRPIILLALFDGVYQGDSSTMRAYLEGVAKRGRMEFLVQAEEGPADA